MLSVLSLSLTRVGVYVGVCVCIPTDTHMLHMGFSDVSTRVVSRHLEGPKNPDGLNLGIYLFVNANKVHMCTYMPGGGIKLFFSLTYIFF